MAKTIVTTATNDGTPVVESGSVKLTRRTIEKGGLISYARPGVRASLYFNKTMFVGDSPTELVLVAEGLRAPYRLAPPPKPTPTQKAATKKRSSKVAKKATPKATKKAAAKKVKSRRSRASK